MGSLAQKERLAENAVVLRRVEPSLPTSECVAAVRADLERLAGPTLTRAMAARLLGVSQPALDEWISRGEIPVVISRSGRWETPTGPLLELAAEVQEHKQADPGDRYPLASVLRRRRVEAERIEPETILPSRYRDTERAGHSRAELRGLAYHRLLAERLDDQMIAEARRRLAEWRSSGKIDERYAEAWERLLSRSRTSIARAIKRDSAAGRDLRQSSPFAGLLNEQERRRILELT